MTVRLRVLTSGKQIWTEHSDLYITNICKVTPMWNTQTQKHFNLISDLNRQCTIQINVKKWGSFLKKIVLLKKSLIYFLLSQSYYNLHYSVIAK